MKLLVISPYFYPYTGVGALRMTSLVEYLGKKNTEITVAKFKNDYYGGYMPEDITWMTNVRPIEYDEEGMNGQQLYENLMQLHKEYVFDCVILTCGPYQTIPPVVSFIKDTKLPLIVDFRDLWLHDAVPKSSLRAHIGFTRYYLKNVRHEQELIKVCTKYVAVTPGNLRIMQKHYPHQMGKGVCIYNGFDEKILKLFQQRNKKDHEECRVCILGKFAYYSQKFCRNFLCAVRNLLQEGYNLKIYHIGAYEPAVHFLAKKVNFPEGALVECGQQEYTQALLTAGQCDISTIIVSYANGLGTKVFDYIAMNKPILCLAPPNSEIEELLQGAENVFVCQKIKSIENALKRILDDPITCLTKDADYAQQFSRTVQNRRYEELICGVLED